jgi:hypothetical protein
MNIDKLTEIERATVFHKMREAAFHLASCWDALREAEDALGADIETDQISGMTSDLNDPGDAYGIEESTLLEVLADLEEGEDTHVPEEAFNGD